jgi:hypothetical protein
MTPHQRAAKINRLRREYRKTILAGRTTTANRIAKELAGLVVERIRHQLKR